MKTSSFLLILSLFLTLPACSKKSKIASLTKRADQSALTKNDASAELDYLKIRQLDPANLHANERLATIYSARSQPQLAFPYLVAVRSLNPSNIPNRLQLAAILLAAGRLPDARTESLAILALDPQNPDASLLLADSSTSAKDLEDSLAFLRAISPPPSSISYHLAVANLLTRQKNLPGAQAELATALALDPSSSQVYLATALFHLSQNQLPLADLAFQKATTLSPLNPAIPVPHSNLKLLLRAPQDARSILAQFLEKQPDSPAASLALAELDFSEKKFPAASKIVDSILAKDPQIFPARLLHLRLTLVASPPAPAAALKEALALQAAFPPTIEINLHLAHAQIQNQDFEAAATTAQAILKLDPAHPQALLLQAELFLKKNQLASAIPPLLTLSQSHPDLLRPSLLLASSYSALGRHPDALAVYTSLQSRFPNAPDLPFLIGKSLRAISPNQPSPLARTAFTKADALSPNQPDIIGQLVELDLLDKNYPAAFERSRNLLALLPSSSTAKVIESSIYLAQRNLPAAQTSLRQALELDPSSLPAANLLAQSLVDQNQLPKAIDTLQFALKSHPNSPQLLGEIAAIYEKLADLPKAIATYESLLASTPNFPPALNNLALLLASTTPPALDRALTLAQSARKLQPASASVADSLAWILFLKHDYSHALPLLEEATTNLPSHPEIQYHLALTLAAIGLEDRARIALSNALNSPFTFPARPDAKSLLDLLSTPLPDPLSPPTDLSPIITSFLTYSQSHPQNLLVLLRLSHLYHLSHQTPLALQSAQAALNLNPASPAALLHLATLLHSLPPELAKDLPKNSPSPLSLATTARQLDPENPQIALLLGRLATQAADWPRAASLLEEALAKLPPQPQILLDLALPSYALGRVATTTDLLTRALQPLPANSPLPPLSPESTAAAQSFLNLLNLIQSPEKIPAAASTIALALATPPRSLPTLFLSALLENSLAHYPAAAQAALTLLTHYPDFTPASKLLASLYADHLNEPAKAQTLAAKARLLTPEDPDLAKILGKVAYQQSDFPTASLYLTEASLKLPNDPDLLYHLGLALHQQKSLPDSTQILSKALALDPASPLAPQAKKILALSPPSPK